MKRSPEPHRPSSASLFNDPERSSMHIANVDGASRGNPGPASYAVIVRGPDGNVEFRAGKYIGRTTNNVAEYYALITALDYAESHKIERFLVRSDSELLVRQMQGRYKVKSPDLRPLYERARKMASGIGHFAIEHVRRELNSDADALANVALDNTAAHSASGGAQSARETAVASAATAKAPAATAPGAANGSQGKRRVRARYESSVLHPLEPLDLAEGQIVYLTVETK